MAGRDGDSKIDYQALSEFRFQIRRFLRASETAAREAGLEPQQHQLLLAVKGMPDGARATVGELAARLQIQHHSTVELVDRLVDRGLVLRKRGTDDRREVLVQLSAKGEKVLRDLSIIHEEELRDTGPELVGVLKRLLAPPAKAAAARKKS